MSWTMSSSLLHTRPHLPSSAPWPGVWPPCVASMGVFACWLLAEVSQWQSTAGGPKTGGEGWWGYFPASLSWWPTAWLCPQTTGQSSYQVASSTEFPFQSPVNIHFRSQSRRTAPSVDPSLNPDQPFLKVPLSNFS